MPTTTEQINIRIATLRGWTSIAWLGDGYDRWLGMPPELGFSREIPDYAGDSNAILEALTMLTPDQREKFIHILALDILHICPLAGDYWMAQEMDCWAILNATPEQLAKAFLMTIDKWN